MLSTETGYSRNYNRWPNQGYEETPRLLFPVPEHRTEVPYVMVYWFAWQAFHPDTELWTP